MDTCTYIYVHLSISVKIYIKIQITSIKMNLCPILYCKKFEVV